MNPPCILPLDDAALSLAVGGGKAVNLALLTRAGFAVPGGFVVTTDAYRLFVAANDLQRAVTAAATISESEAGRLDEVSADIRAHFARGTVPPDVASAIRSAYVALGATPVAVRSSATTEDLPELSFAGQQETALNVVGSDALLDAVVRCWSSLWTARAIAYRARHGMSHGDVALAVVVQQMIQSDASGVLFTANPLSGKRTEAVIEATLGLGEALVSGLVEPDRYVVDPSSPRVVRTTLGQKALEMFGRPEGGTTTVQRDGAGRQALPDAAVLELAELGARVADLLGAPQDIEWAWAAGKLHLLQSRPITSLYPLPTEADGGQLQVLISLGAVQGMLDPFTPLGRDVFRLGAARVASLVRASATPQSQRILLVAGDRLFINVAGALRNARARPLVRRALSMVEPGIARAVERLLVDERLQPNHDSFSFATLFRVLPLQTRVLGNACFHLLWPDAGRARIQSCIATAVAAFESECARGTTLSQRLALCDNLFGAVRRFGPVLMPGVAVGLGSLRALHALVAHLPGAEPQVLEITRGLPHNVTTEMDLALWETAVAITADSGAAAQLAESDVDTLAALWGTGSLAPTAQVAIDAFLHRFGMRGVAEIDVGRPRWREDPRLLLQALKSYARIDDPDRAPDRVFRRGAAAAEATIVALGDMARRTAWGWFRAWGVRWAARRVRALAGLRESPKFTAIRLMGHLRAVLLLSGEELAATGVLVRADDLFFLDMDEAQALARGESREWRALVATRRAAFAKEQRRRPVPLLLLSDGVAFFAEGHESADADDAGLVGTPVSPGVVEGLVRVVRDPHAARLEPGEILVCPGTDPAWTPLFLSAGGLVTEVGGLMTHGSVVAREYGIPAVVGVARATTRLATGVRVRVDGGRGTVTILEARGTAPVSDTAERFLRGDAEVCI